MEELKYALQTAKNVETLTWDSESQRWTITYKNDPLRSDSMESDALIDFLINI